ncbi:MAG TPA: HD domain-containing phosphohydrolase [Candidatus Limnocylindrales bacterium]|nr:HD domain-containing phosphohydrolase [Candidatus Limnocylindrales bacterium]
MARFSLALGAVLAATTIALSVGTAYLLSRYVADETSSFTQDAVASHFGTVFRDDVFQRGLSPAESAELTQFVTFHFSIYNVVATQFFDRNGKIVFSYDTSEVGRNIEPRSVPGLAEALAGMRSSKRTPIIADPRLGVPGSTVGFGSFNVSHHAGASADSASVPPGMARISALETWVPVTEKGQTVGAVVVWRNMASIDAALMRIQMTMAAIILAAAVLLWLVLRGVYMRSSKQIVAQARDLEVALVDRERSYDSTLEALANALDVRDSETGGHSDRVLQYMELVIEEVGVDPKTVSVLRRGALLHDIGKIGVPDNILRKPTALSDSEWVTMRKHPEYGARIVAGIPFLEEVSEIVRHHHEKWDGTGYPDRLAGEDIPVGARIFAVADSFDAMTSDRPYRRALSIEAACAEVIRCRGTQFDPAVADAFARIPRERLARIAADAPHTHPVAVAG